MRRARRLLQARTDERARVVILEPAGHGLAAALELLARRTRPVTRR